MPVAQKNNSISCARSTFGDKNAMFAAWADFAASPIVTTFRWSPLVELAFDNNREVIAPTTVSQPPLSAVPYATPNAARYPSIPGLLVLHLRRGDYAGHCEHLAGRVERTFFHTGLLECRS